MPENKVTITDIQMPFQSMVIFMVKWAIAAIPAFVILVILGTLSVILTLAIIIGFMGFSIDRLKSHSSQAPIYQSSTANFPLKMKTWRFKTNCFNAPSSDSFSLIQFDKDETVNVVGKDGDWLLVNTEKANCYCRSKDLKLVL